MPIWASIDPIRRHWLTLLLLIDVAYGVVNLFGHGISPWCGAAMLLSAPLILLGWSVAGAGIATVGWSAAMFAGNDNPILLGGMAGWFVLVIYDCGTGLDVEREISQRRP